MKKLFILFAAITLTFSAQAQELGLRWGDTVGNDVAIDGIVSIGDYSRIHADVSFGNGGVGLDGLIDFVYRPLFGDESLYWYVGAGASSFLGDDFLLGGSGELGLQYTFDFPMSLSADWRPTLWIIKPDGADAFYGDSFGINIRYVF